MECSPLLTGMPRGSNLQGSAASSDRYSRVRPIPKLSGGAAGQHAAAMHMRFAHDDSEEVKLAAAEAHRTAAASSTLTYNMHVPVTTACDFSVICHSGNNIKEALQTYNELAFERVHIWNQQKCSWPEACVIADKSLLETASTRVLPLSTSTRRQRGGDSVADAVVSHVGRCRR